MVETALTSELIDAGKELVSMLDGTELKVRSALWFYFDDIERYRLVLEVRGLDKKGPKKIYQKIQVALRKTESAKIVLSLEEISLIKETSPLIALFRGVMKIGSPTTTGSARFTNTTINGHLIDDALIYRLS